MTRHEGADDVIAFRLVTRVFLRRLIDNDLISPHADRHESLAVLYSVVISVAVFGTFFMSTDYLAELVLLPGPAALFLRTTTSAQRQANCCHSSYGTSH